MWWRILSGLFLGVWLSLFAVEFCQDLGLFDYDDPGMDQSMNATLASLEDAIQLDDHHHPLKTVFPAFSLGTLDHFPHQSLPIPSVKEVLSFIMSSREIIKLYHIFII